MITVNLIIEAIATALNGEFGEEYTVYAEDVKQGLAARYYRENRFCIQYFPLEENNGRQESYDKAERLFGCLEEISADGDIIRGTDMNFEYTDGILSFFVSYNFFVYRTREPTVMEKFGRDVLNK